MISLPKLDASLVFPPPAHALDDPNGLLAFGGDLSVERLINAYENGIFPWFSEGEPILWWSPSPRGILQFNNYHAPKSLLKFIRKSRYSVTINHAFNQVIDACATVPRGDQGTWITCGMISAYKALHLAGKAHSIEVWDDNNLVGGLYGVAVGRVFCGESMFSLASNASKMAFHYLVTHLQASGAEFIDCQMQNDHLKRFGCAEVSREQFLNMLENNRHKQVKSNTWQRNTLNKAR